jgi:imidazolonepropionase-like amidohydrolase
MNSANRVALSALLLLLAAAATSCTSTTAPETSAPAGAGRVTAFVGARIAADPSAEPINDGVLLVRNGRVDAVGPVSTIMVPEGAQVVDHKGKFIVPGMISAHVHVSDVNGQKPREYTEANTLRQLGVFARYGFTTVLSLGGEKEPAFTLRDAQQHTSLDRARLFVSGDVITATTPEQGRAEVARVAALKPDWIKIRVDDNLGTGKKMSPDVYRAIIQESHARRLRVAAHIFYLDDAKDLLKSGADMIAHSVRDKEIDAEFIELMKARNIPYCPTLTRELSTFVYASKPAFFDDPFFRKEADSEVVAHLLDAKTQQEFRTSKSGAAYKAALAVAKRNLKKASDAGLQVVLGTDAGPFPERFQGYFEHLEMDMMAEAGLSPKAILISATSAAAQALGKDDLGVLKPGAWADFVALDQDPLENIRNIHSIAEVRIAGNPVPASRGESSK